MRISYVGNDAGWINYDKAVEVANLISSIRPMQDNYLNPDYYPPIELNLEIQAMYFMAMVAIDHRLNIPGHPFEATINGKRYVGSDLLWKLGADKLKEDESFFTPSRLAKLRPSDVKDWLGDVWDYGIRAFLLSDLGIKIISMFNGSALNALRSTGGRLLGPSGFTELMRNFAAYTDPVEKKTHLLAKFLHGRGIIKFTDVNNAQVAVDNHLTRIAIRLGLVELSQRFINMIKNNIPFTPKDDVNLRSLVRDSWKIVSMNSHIDAFSLDDYLWNLGRSTCIYDKPDCSKCQLRSACNAYKNGVFINEHRFYVTFWY